MPLGRRSGRQSEISKRGSPAAPFGYLPCSYAATIFCTTRPPICPACLRVSLRLPFRLMPSSCAASILYCRRAACEVFCEARAVTRPRPPAAGFFVEEELDVLFFAVLLFAVLFFAAGADFVLLPLARVLAALLRLAAVVLLEAIVFAAWVLAAAVGFFAVEEVLFFAVLVFAVLLLTLANVLAALLRAEALLPLFASVLAALLLPEAGLLVAICISLLSLFYAF